MRMERSRKSNGIFAQAEPASSASVLGDGYPSAVLLIRRIRPLVSVLGMMAYLLYRISPQFHDTTLLTCLIDGLSMTRIWLQSVLLPAPLFLQPCVTILCNLMEDILAISAVLSLFRVVYVLYHYDWNDWKSLVVTNIFDMAKHNLSFVQNELDKQSQDMNQKGASLLRKKSNRQIITRLPKQGRLAQDVLKELQDNATEENKRWQSGKVSGTVYQGCEDHTHLMNQVYSAYSWSNPLHPGFWPKLNQCEGEVIAMTAHMMHAPQAIGCMSSGGTESILLAIRAHLNYYGKARGIRYPELICGSTAHAAVDKACDIFGIRKVVIDCSQSPTFQMDPLQVQRHVTSNTIMIYSSAPCYPQGVVDPISELSNVARLYDIGLHVDACLGGFVLPFLDDVPVFDFRNRGVTSMSADTHKYGYASKGTSVVLYRHKELRHGQYFCYAHWTGGMYTTPTFAGSRPGALSACAWASLVSIGEDGYRVRAQAIVKAARAIAKGVGQIPGLVLLTQPKPYMVVCFASHEFDIYRVQDMMSEKDWALNAMQSPASIHLCVTMNVVPKVLEFLKDLEVAVAQVRKEGSSGQKKGTAGIYGTVGSVPAGAVEPSLRAFTDMCLTP